MKNKLEHIKVLSEEAIEYHKKAISVQNQIIDTVDLALQDLNEGISNITISRIRTTGEVDMSWYGLSNKEIDVQYEVDGNGKWHSIRWMIEDDKDDDEFDYNPPPLPEQVDGHNEYSFKIPPKKPLKVRLVEGEYRKDVHQFYVDKVLEEEPFEGVEQSDDEDEETEIDLPDVPDKEIWFGWWDSHKAGEARTVANANMIPVPDPAWENALDYSEKVIPMIGGFGDTGDAKTDHQIQRRASMFHDKFEQYADRIAYVVVQDEPWSRGKMSNEQVKIMCDSAKNEFVKTAITITKGTVNNDNRIIPDSVDIVQVQAFPFLPADAEPGHAQIWTKNEFMDYWGTLIGRIQEKAPGKPIVISPQLFSDRKWRKPPLWSPMAYAELIVKYPNVKGFLGYVWHDKGGANGLNQMPDLFEEVKKAYNFLIK